MRRCIASALRQRDDSSSGAPGKTPKTDALLSVSHVAIEDGTIVMSDKQRGIENRLDKVRRRCNDRC